MSATLARKPDTREAELKRQLALAAQVLRDEAPVLRELAKK